MDHDDIYMMAEELFCEHFMYEHGREPTQAEIDANIDDYYVDIISGMADRAFDEYKDGLYEK